MSRPPATPGAYLVPLDGLRALAIIAVIVFHLYPAALPGGFTGVDVFYVLSGFIITRTIQQAIDERRFSLREFYLRRILRLLPNALLTVATVLVIWTLLMTPSQIAQTAHHGLWTLGNVSNIFMYRRLGDYWGEVAEWAPLTHTWSLGIEEQFYLLYPLSLLVLTQFQRPRLAAWLAGIATVSFGAGVIGYHSHPLATFYLLPTRVWELLLGACLALAHLRAQSHVRIGTASSSPADSRRRTAAGILGLALTGLGFAAISNGGKFLGLLTLAPTVGATLLLYAITGPANRLAQVFASAPLVAIGRRSYSLYLWHWPMIVLGRYWAATHGFVPLAGTLAGGAAGIVAACVAYAAVENPLRNPGLGRTGRLTLVAAGFAATFLFALALIRNPAMSGQIAAFDQPAFQGKFYDSDMAGPGLPNEVVRYADVKFPPFPPRPVPWKTGGIIRLYGAPQPQLVVLGSSHALMYSRLIDDICREQRISVAFLAAGGRPVFFGHSPSPDTPPQLDDFDLARLHFLRTWRPTAAIVIDRWDARFASTHGFESQLRALLDTLRPLTPHVIFATQVPVLERGEKDNLREVVAELMKQPQLGLPRLAPDPAEPLRLRAAATAEALARERPDLRVLRPDRFFYRPDGSVRYAEGRHFYYADDDHLSDVGAEQARAIFTQAIAAALAPAAPRQ